MPNLSVICCGICWLLISDSMDRPAGAGSGSLRRQTATSGRSSQLPTGGICWRCTAAKATSGLLNERRSVAGLRPFNHADRTALQALGRYLQTIFANSCFSKCADVCTCWSCRDPSICGRREVRAWLVVDEVPAMATPAAATPALAGSLPDEVVLGNGAHTSAERSRAHGVG